MSHLKTHHKEVHDKILQDLESRKDPKPAEKLKPSILNGVKMSGRALQVHCIRLVSQHGLSFKSLDYAALQAILRPMIEAMPASERVTISSRSIPPKICDMASAIRAKIMGELDGKMVSIKVDGCSKNSRYFLGTNVQYILSGKIVIRTLAVEELFISTTAANFKARICHILKMYRIPIKNVVSFTSDNGANYILACKLMDEDSEDSCCDSPWADAEIELLHDEFHIQSIRCAAHTLELSIGDARKENFEIKPLLDKVRKLANFLKNETNVRQLKENEKSLPTTDVVTRWGSTYDMLASVSKLRNFTEISLNVSNKDRSQYFLDDDEWDALDSTLDDLLPARQATTQLQHQNLTLGDFYAVWMELQMKLEKKKTPLSTSLVKAMTERSRSVNYRDARKGERLPALFHSPSFNSAVFLDPRYFSLLSPEQISDAKAYLCELWARVQKARGVAVEPEPEETVDEPEELDSEDSSLFEQLLASKNKGRFPDGEVAAANKNTIRALLDEYDRTTKPLPRKTDVLEYWEKRRRVSPELHELALIVLAIPATEVSVERLFSSLKFILRPQRFNLQGSNVDHILVLHANSELVKEYANEVMVLEKLPNPERSSSSSSASSCSSGSL
ncbi:Zinc finger BED domain-containing protein 4 [Frankliniella fusca]|uniref:Zinc finger BED domain-containing protein 4 n=1 Tax=Frankliniella fusca TaxID=407009 RepID=A0AAE1LW51_9NEOP|nr:Zinc finger BED domain-containing protein 4 [Frankliniella fusca]